MAIPAVQQRLSARCLRQPATSAMMSPRRNHRAPPTARQCDRAPAPVLSQRPHRRTPASHRRPRPWSQYSPPSTTVPAVPRQRRRARRRGIPRRIRSKSRRRSRSPVSVSRHRAAATPRRGPPVHRAPDNPVGAHSASERYAVAAAWHVCGSTPAMCGNPARELLLCSWSRSFGIAPARTICRSAPVVCSQIDPDDIWKVKWRPDARVKSLRPRARGAADRWHPTPWDAVAWHRFGQRLSGRCSRTR